MRLQCLLYHTSTGAPLFFTVIFSNFSQVNRILSNPRSVSPKPRRMTEVNSGHVAASDKMLDSWMNPSFWNQYLYSNWRVRRDGVRIQSGERSMDLLKLSCKHICDTIWWGCDVLALVMWSWSRSCACYMMKNYNGYEYDATTSLEHDFLLPYDLSLLTLIHAN